LNSETRGDRRPPFFTLGNSQVCGRISRLEARIAEQETAAGQPE
jgi:hypothetical protein